MRVGHGVIVTPGRTRGGAFTPAQDATAQTGAGHPRAKGQEGSPLTTVTSTSNLSLRTSSPATGCDSVLGGHTDECHRCLGKATSIHWLTARKVPGDVLGAEGSVAKKQPLELGLQGQVGLSNREAAGTGRCEPHGNMKSHVSEAGNALSVGKPLPTFSSRYSKHQRAAQNSWPMFRRATHAHGWVFSVQKGRAPASSV